jgi:hypothetical protein
LALTPSEQLPMGFLSDLNKRLVDPIQLGLKRPQQKSYPQIYGLYLLARASGLTNIGGTPKKPLLSVDDEVYRQWLTLNPTERYFALLETWMFRGKPEVLGERDHTIGLIPDNFPRTARFYVGIPESGLPVAGHRDVETELMYNPGWYNLGLLDLFGLIRVERGLPEPGQGWRINTIHRTGLGNAVLAVLYSGFFSDLDKIFALEDSGELPIGVLHPVFGSYFPEWKNNLTVPRWEFRDGAYTFKVSLGPIWRRIAIGGRQTLDELAAYILDSVDFDHDHLYEFSYRNRFGAVETIVHPYMEEGRFTSDVFVGDVPLGIGQTMVYHFDFGDDWQFDVTLEGVDPAKSIKQPRILETHGTAPEQYPTWDE